MSLNLHISLLPRDYPPTGSLLLRLLILSSLGAYPSFSAADTFKLALLTSPLLTALSTLRPSTPIFGPVKLCLLASNLPHLRNEQNTPSHDH